jgi:hypothetical protein
MKRLTIITSTLVTAAMITACVGSDQDSSAELASVEQALEMENGGYDVADAQPMFGDPEAFQELELDIEDQELTDSQMIHGPEGRPDPSELLEGVNVLVFWGQVRPNPELEVPTRWDGRLAVTDGAMRLRRLVRFEGPTDELLPRPNRRVVPFRSATLPHNDGLLVTLLRPVDPSTEVPGAELRLELEGKAPVVVDVADLVAGHRLIVPVDDLGNVVVMTTAPAHPCPHGILSGVWQELRSDLGTFRGRWMGAHGQLHGHVKGIWGINRAGRRVMFGKYIGNDGRFRGLIRGVWGEGRFTAVFVDADGAYRGGLGGRYGTVDAPLHGDGLFGGRWVEACEAERCGPDGACPGLEPEVPGADQVR